MPSDLLKTLLTTDDRELLRTELTLLKDAVFKLKKNTFAESLKTRVRSDVAEIIEREVRTEKQDPEKYIADVLKQIDKVPTLQLTIAFEPTDANLEHVAVEASTIVGQSVILQIVVQPEIIGGAVIIWNGRYHDASLKTKFSEIADKVIHEKL